MTSRRPAKALTPSELIDHAAQLRNDDHLDKAERVIAGVLKQLGKKGENSDDGVLATLEHGVILQLRGRMKQAIRMFAKAGKLVGRPKRSDSDDRSTLYVRAMLGQASCLRAGGDLDASERMYTRALELTEKRFGKRHLLVADVLNDFGVLRKAQGRYADALRAYRQALPIVVRELGANSNDAATLYHNLGGSEHARGRYAQAEPWARKSVAVRRKLLGDKHLHVAADRAALAAVLESRGKFAEAHALYRQVLAAFRRADLQGEVAFNLANLATLLQRSGKAKAAELKYLEAIPMLRKHAGPNDPQLALAHGNYGVLLTGLGRTREALQQLDHACAIARVVLPADHPTRTLFEHNRIATRAMHDAADPKPKRR